MTGNRNVLRHCVILHWRIGCEEILLPDSAVGKGKFVQITIGSDSFVAETQLSEALMLLNGTIV